MNFTECIVPNTLSIKSLYTSFAATRAANYRFGGEIHNFWEAVFVTSGKIGVCSETEIISLEKGDCILHAPMEFHSIWTEGQDTAGIIVISFQTENPVSLEQNIFSLPESELFTITRLQNNIKECFDNPSIAVRGIKENHMPDAEICIKELEAFFLKMISFHKKPAPVKKENSSKGALLFADVVYFLSNNIDLDLNMDEIAEKCNVSRSNLKKLFAKYLGMGVMHYFTMMKVRRAEEYLKSGMSVKECAAKLNFCDQNYFSTVYKKYLGFSPSETIRKSKI